MFTQQKKLHMDAFRNDHRSKVLLTVHTELFRMGVEPCFYQGFWTIGIDIFEKNLDPNHFVLSNLDQMCPNIFQQHLLVDFLAKFLTCQFQIQRIISIQRELYPVRTSIMNEKIVLWKGVNIWRVHSMYYVCKLHPTWWSRYNVWVVSEILPWDQKKELQTKTYQIWYFSKPIVSKRQSRKAR